MLRTANGSQSFDDGQEEKEQSSSANFFSNFFAKAAAAAASSSSGSAGARPADADPEETTPAGQPQGEWEVSQQCDVRSFQEANSILVASAPPHSKWRLRRRVRRVDASRSAQSGAHLEGELRLILP